MGVIRVEEEKFRLPVDVGGSKTSVLKLSNMFGAIQGRSQDFPKCDHTVSE